MKREGITRAVARMAREDKRLKVEAALRAAHAAVTEKREQHRNTVRRYLFGLTIFALIASVVGFDSLANYAWTAFKKEHACVALSKNGDVTTMVATSDGTNIMLVPLIVPGTTNWQCNDGKVYEGY